jgi:hypothetical protein
MKQGLNPASSLINISLQNPSLFKSLDHLFYSSHSKLLEMRKKQAK